MSLRLALTTLVCALLIVQPLDAQGSDRSTRESVTVASVLRDVWGAISSIFSGRPAETAERVQVSGVGGSANEPPGFTRRLERSFGSVDEDGWFRSNNTRFSIVASPFRPGGTGGTGQMRFDTTFPTGGSPAKISRRFDPAREGYLAFWFQISPNYVGSPQDVSKVLYLENRLGATCRQKVSFFNALTGKGEGGFSFASFTQDTEIQRGRRLNPNRTNVRIEGGQWYLIEQLLVANTPGITNGEVHTWVNGVKTTEYSDIGWVRENASCPAAGEWFGVQWNPVWGRRNNENDRALLASRGTFYQWIDQIYVSGR